MKISVIIPTFKNNEMFLKNLSHNFKFLEDCQVIVVDDGSKEDIYQTLKKRFPTVLCIENSENIGFAKSVNIGAAASTGDFLFLLNTDVLLSDKSYLQAVESMKKQADLFAVSFAQREKNGTIVGKNRIYFARGLVFHEKNANLTAGLNAWAEGGSCIIRKKYFDELGGLDSLYSPFYWEDIDLSYRAYKHGWQVLFDPAIIVEHHHESTIGKYFDKKMVKTISFRNQITFTVKNLTDINLIFWHIVLMPFNIVYYVLKGEWRFIHGLVAVIARLGQIVSARHRAKNKRGDTEVLELFKT